MEQNFGVTEWEANANEMKTLLWPWPGPKRAGLCSRSGRSQHSQPARSRQAGVGPHLPPLASHFLHSLPTSAATSCRQICWCLPMFGKPPKPRSKQQSKLVKNAVSSLENSWSSDSVRNGHKDSTETVALRAKYVVIEKKKKAAVGAMLLIIPHIWGTGTTQFKVKSNAPLTWPGHTWPLQIRSCGPTNVQVAMNKRKLWLLVPWPTFVRGTRYYWTQSKMSKPTHVLCVHTASPSQGFP